MKKLVLLLFAGMLLTPSEMFAKWYKGKNILIMPHTPKMPAQYYFSFYLDEDSGNLSITPNDVITGLNITITANGVTYLDTTVSLSFGQSYTDCLDYLPVGMYILTLSTADGVIDQYEITVEDD